MTTHADFLAERKTGFGGSDASGLLNEGYGCARRLVYDKAFVPEDYPKDENLAMALGKILEPFFRDQYAAKTGRAVLEITGALRHQQYPFFLVHLDGAIHAEAWRPPGALELKAFGDPMFRQMRREGLPIDYVLQLQWGMMVAGYTWGSFGIGSRSSGETKFWDAEQDHEIKYALEAKGLELWAKVLDARAGSNMVNAPAPLPPDDKRCVSCQWRIKCQGAALMPKLSKEETAAPEVFPLYKTYQQQSELVKEAEELLEETKQLIKDGMGERQAVRMPNGKPIYWRPQTSMRGDFAELSKAYEDLRKKFAESEPPAESFKKPSESRPLRIF